MPGTRTGSNGRKRFDEDLLVRLMAEDRWTQHHIARRVGISQAMVSQIARGKTRRDLLERIRRCRNQWQKEARHLAEDHVRSLLIKHLQVAIEETGETARKCREYLLNQLLFPRDSRSGRSGRSGSGESKTRSLIVPPDLAKDFYRWQSETFGGPKSSKSGEA
jgi:predicted transcriptional regulator